MDIIDVTIEGRRPILFNRMTQDQLLAIYNKEKKPKNQARPEPRDWAEQRLYRTNDGVPCIPVNMMMACLIGGGRFVRLEGKKMVSTAKGSLLPGLLTIVDDVLPIIRLDGKPPVWEVDVQGGKNPNGGEAVCIIRPRFDIWAAKMTIRIDTVSLGEPAFRDLFDFAGMRCGLGDFRPEKRGTYGLWQVQCWEKRDTKSDKDSKPRRRAEAQAEAAE
jgi:hypothetical protein